MAWWGKVIGGTFGFMLGGPIGALLGASFGHQFDARAPAPALERGDHGDYGGDYGAEFFGQPGDQERVQAAFFTATFAVLGHLAKADGRVSRAEIALATQLMDNLQLDGDQRKVAQALFSQGKGAGFDLDAVLAQFRRECHRRSTLVQMFVEIQIQAALADGRIAPEESRVLRRVAQALGLSRGDLERLIRQIRGADSYHAHGERASLKDAHRILGVNENTPLAEVRRAYRRLMSRHHPDKLVAKGLPEEMVKLANDKTAEARAAWETIKQARAG